MKKSGGLRPLNLGRSNLKKNMSVMIKFNFAILLKVKSSDIWSNKTKIISIIEENKEIFKRNKDIREK